MSKFLFAILATMLAAPAYAALTPSVPGTGPCLPGFKRIVPRYCQAAPRVTVTGADWSTPGTLEINLTSYLTPVPSALSFVVLSFQLQPNASGVSGTANSINVHSVSDAAGTQFYESAVFSLTEQVGGLAVGTALGLSTPMIKFPTHGGPSAARIYRNTIVIGGGGSVNIVRLLGYYD